MTQPPLNQELEREVAELVELALEDHVSLNRLIETIEEALLKAAIRKHATQQEAYLALKIPRTSYFSKKRKYFDP